MFDRIQLALRRLIQEVLNERLPGVYAYSVDSYDANSETISATPLRDGTRLPAISKVKIRSPLLRLVLKSQQQILVCFEGENPAFPIVLPFDLTSGFSDAIPIAQQGGAVATTLFLVPALSPTGLPIPGVFTILIDPMKPPPPPPFDPVKGGPVMFFGTITTGSLRIKGLGK